jgi:diguanylate cyclase (GGDEF)-like protein
MLSRLVARLKRNPFDIFVIAAAVSAIAVGTTFINTTTIETLLHRDAERAAGNMSRFLAASLPDLENLMSGGKLSAKSVELLDFGRAAAEVEHYEIYNAEGEQVLEYEEAGETPEEEEEAEREHENLKEHQPQVFKQILAGEPHVESFEKDRDGKTIFQSEGYAPIKREDKLIGVLEVYLDQTAKKASFENAVKNSSLEVLGILLAGLAVPILLYRRRLLEKEVVEDCVKYLAQYDDLTGLMNRASLQDRLIATLEEVKKEEESRAALFFIDVDRFKEINDNHGHAGGDAVLKCTAERLSLIVGSAGHVSRFGGDQFAVLMPAVNDRHSVEVFAAELVSCMAKPYPTLDHDVVATVSIGISLIPDDAASADLVLRHADLATYAAKMGGRNGYRFYDPSLDEQYARKLAVERAVRRACAANAFTIEYQPQFALDSHALIGFEALLRMEDPDIGPVPPAEFIPFAEEMGLIPQIGEWVLREACRFAVLWPAPLSIAVNLSPLQFRDGTLPKLVAAILGETKLAPQRLELEVTEGLILANTESVMNQIRAIRALGVSFAMDDFGTKYSSLSYLWNFTFDKIKIDRDFVRNLGSAEKAAQILETIISLGKTLNLSITAEGVESPEQAQFLAEHHCDSVQGFLFGRPMPATDVPAAIVQDFQRHRMPREEVTLPRLSEQRVA